MLIFDGRYSGYGKDKPKQWGSISAVRTAVFRNASAMGIDPQSIADYFPFFEGVGKGISSTSGNAVRGINHVGAFRSGARYSQIKMSGVTNFSNHDDLIVIVGSETGKLDTTDKLSIFASGYYKGEISDQYRAFCAKRNDDGYQYHFRIHEGKLNFLGSSGSVAGPSVPTEGLFRYGVTNDSGGSLFFYREGKQSAVYGGKLLTHTDSVFTIGNTLTSAFHSFSGGDAASGLDTLLIYDGILSPFQMAVLSDTPYALLQPNPTPLIFDWGAGGGTQLSYLYGSAAIITTNMSSLLDSSAKTSSSVSDVYDSNVQVSKAIGQVFDSAAKVVSVISDSYDTKTTVQTDLVSLLDTEASGSTTISGDYGTSAIVQTVGTLVYNFDTLVKVTTDISDEYDTKAACSTLDVNVYDSTTKASTSISNQIDTKAVTSTLDVSVYDTKTVTSTLRKYSYDTRAIIATVIEKLVDSSISVTSVLTQLYDTVCAVTEATSGTGTLTPETIDAIATAVWAKMLDSGMAAKAVLDMAATESTKARQMQTNNAEVAEDGSQSVIYDDDGVTPLVTFNHPTTKKRVKV